VGAAAEVLGGNDGGGEIGQQAIRVDGEVDRAVIAGQGAALERLGEISRDDVVPE
jgi:hypothetical protein